MRRLNGKTICTALSLTFLLLLTEDAGARTPTNEVGQDETVNQSPMDAATAARRLTDRDPLVRQRAAEELARLASVEHRKLVEGYRLQEKNARVRLALDWALYRTGKREALYAVVRDLDTRRYTQAQAYLADLETPEPLYPILPLTDGSTQARLLEALARAGDEKTLEVIAPYMSSPDPQIADAARFAEREIKRRLANGAQPPGTRTRTRRAGQGSGGVDKP